MLKLGELHAYYCLGVNAYQHVQTLIVQMLCAENIEEGDFI